MIGLNGQAPYLRLLDIAVFHSLPPPGATSHRGGPRRAGRQDRVEPADERTHVGGDARALFRELVRGFQILSAPNSTAANCRNLDEATAALFPATFQDSLLGHISSGWKLGSIGRLGPSLSLDRDLGGNRADRRAKPALLVGFTVPGSIPTSKVDALERSPTLISRPIEASRSSATNSTATPNHESPAVAPRNAPSGQVASRKSINVQPIVCWFQLLPHRETRMMFRFRIRISVD